MIPYGQQNISQKDIDSVIDVLGSDFLTQGPKVPEFEESLCIHADCKHAIAVNSATSALHIGCLALGLGTGDWLWTTPISFVASANCGLYCGAKVDFVDIDLQTYNICINSLEEKLILAKKQGLLPKVLVVVHLGGEPCDMRAIYRLSKEYSFKVIEDASHAVGSKYFDEPVGNCRYSEITIFSFHPVKIVTTGEGGAALTNSDELAQKMRLLRSHGITREPNLMTEDLHGPWYYQQILLGFNYRMTDIHAALGISQMQRLEKFIMKRHDLSKIYHELLADLPVILPFNNSNSRSSLHLFIIRLSSELLKRKSRRQVVENLLNEGVGANIHYIPIHIQPFFARMGFKTSDFPKAIHYYESAISLPFTLI